MCLASRGTLRLLEWQGKLVEALSVLEGGWPEIPGNARTLGLFLKAAIHQDLRCHDEAIEGYRKVLKDANFEGAGTAWYNLGNAYSGKGKRQEAIKAYRKALEEPRHYCPSDVWHNVGLTYVFMADYEEAIKAYRRALEDQKPDMNVKTLTNLGEAYQKAGKRKEAGEALEAALEKPDPDGYDHSRARELLFLLDVELKPEAMSEGDRALLEGPAAVGEEAGPEQRILSKVRTAEQSQYDKYLERESSERDNVLSILRGWSSAVTLMEGSEGLWRGGGYFLKWEGKGIVIDPGLDFLRNFHDAAYHGREIDAVLVSHNHSDHNADVRRIDDLRYELYKRRKKDRDGGIGAYLLIWDAESNGTVSLTGEEPEHRFTPIVFDRGRCQPCNTISQVRRLPFSVRYFEAKHGEDAEEAVGFKLTLKKGGEDFTLGFTGDTEFFPELCTHLEGCDVLLAHISQPDERELMNPKERKKHHLGYRGVAELVKGAKPKLTLVGEFWAGLTDLRIDLVKGLRVRAGTEAILPAGIGMHLHLPGMEVECTECRAKIPFGDVRVAPPANPFGALGYLCTRCFLG